MIRILFESIGDFNINEYDVFEKYTENYLDDFNAEFSGYIVMDANKLKLEKMEPLWQYIIWDDSIQLDTIKEYILKNPVKGYKIHLGVK